LDEKMKEFKWERFGDKYYYYDNMTGKIVGAVNKIALQEVWISVVYTGEYSFTINDEKHLGQYISLDYAKEATQRFWDIQNRTLLEN
jgi:hypothetical protein